MDTSSFENQVLLLANEGYSGLWEVYFEAKTKFGDLSESDLIQKARNVISNMLEAGWIQIYLWKEPFSKERLMPIKDAEVTKVLSEDGYWQPPDKGNESIWFLATEEGEKIFSKRYLN
jgi:hypothetical protein